MVGYRSKSREIIFQILFGLNFIKYQIEDIEDIIKNFEEGFRENDYEIDMRYLNKQYSSEMLNGIKFNEYKIDELISNHSEKWKIGRLAKTDLSILRLAIYEMCFKMLDPRIAINEAINLSKKYSGDKSPAYINGVLNALKDIKIEE